MSKQQRLVLVVCILASFVAFLDGAIVNVALPAIARDLGGGLSAQQWIVDAYLLLLGSLILIAGSLSDLLGRKRILNLGLISFGIFSLLCALAPSSTLLIIFRALQGAAGALLVPSSLALIIATFSGKAEGKAIGTWTAYTGVSFIIGPLLGGFLVDKASWRWIFAINVVPIAITLYLLTRVKVADHQADKAGVDLIGAVLCAVGLGGPVFALIEESRFGWTSPLIYLPLVLGIIFFASFLIYEKRVSKPMLPLSLFNNHNFSVGNIATFAVYAGLSASTFLIVVFLQQVSGYSALAAGLSLLPVTILMFLLSPRSGALAGTYGPRLFMGLGPIVAAVGFLLMLRVGSSVNYWSQLLPAIIVFGLGLVLTVAPLTAAILGDVPKDEAGIASAVNNAVARVAGLIAIAAVGAVVASQFTNSLSTNPYLSSLNRSVVSTARQTPLVISPPKAYSHDQKFKSALEKASIDSFHTGMLSVAIMVAVGGIISLLGIRNPRTKPIEMSKD